MRIRRRHLVKSRTGSRLKRAIQAPLGLVLSALFYLVMWALSQAYPHRFHTVTEAPPRPRPAEDVPAEELGSATIDNLLALMGMGLLVFLVVCVVHLYLVMFR